MCTHSENGYVGYVCLHGLSHFHALSYSLTFLFCSTVLCLTACNQRTVSLLRRPFCPSVCLSVKRMHYDKTKETCANILIQYERTFILVFRHEEWLVGDDPLYPNFWETNPVRAKKRRFSVDIRS